MANVEGPLDHGAVAAWAKRCYFAGRAVMESVLRPYGLGASQFYVLHQLATAGPTMQRDLPRMLQVERATLSVIVGALVRKGLVEQTPDLADERRKLLRLTQAGEKLWRELPDLAFIRTAAFRGVADHDLAVAVDVLRRATERLDALLKQGADP